MACKIGLPFGIGLLSRGVVKSCRVFSSTSKLRRLNKSHKLVINTNNNASLLTRSLANPAGKISIVTTYQLSLSPVITSTARISTLTVLLRGSPPQVVSIRRREDNLPVYPEPSSPQAPSSQSFSTSSHVKSDSDMSSQPSAAVVEAVVAKVDELQNGQMKEVDIGDKKVLLVKEDGQFYAIGNKCTHYGGPLAKGAYCKGVVRCPWHGACFNIKTGDIEDFPGLDSLHTFDVTVKGQDVVVKANVADLENKKRVRPLVKKRDDVKQTAVLVGGGPSSTVCAQTLREEGFQGRIVMVCKESHLPYDRVKLSKAMSSKAEDLALRQKDFYDTNGIELVLGKEVTSVKASDSSIVLDDGQTLPYNFLLLATGGQPRRLPIPGIDLQNVYFLRTPEDANSIHENAQNKRVIIVGSSFIGLEVASYLVNKAASVTVIGRSGCPLSNVFGDQIGLWFRKLHESKGVQFHFETSVKELRGEDGKVKEAVLSNGETLQAEVVVMGVGVIPATDFLKGSGVEMSNVGYVPVNKNMETNMPGVFAAGDIVEFPLFCEGNKAVNIQHYQMAHKHGRTAGLSMAGKPQEIHSVPYFWTAQFGKSIRYCGYGPGYDDVVLHGNLDEGKFVAFYTKEDRVVAVASLGWDPIVSQAAELFSKGGKISKEEVRSDPSSAWLSRL